jgi:hypothetical protein
MASSVSSLIDGLRTLLLQDPEDLMDDYEDFASMVTNLRDYSWHEFLDCLLALRDRMIKDFPFISAVEESHCNSQRTNAAIFDEMWLVKEGVCMYESTLAASFDEEDSIEHQLAKMRLEVEQLEDKKRKLKKDIKDDIAKLLEKRHTLLELQNRQRAHGEDASNIHGDLAIARECRRKIEELWDNAREAADQA